VMVVRVFCSGEWFVKPEKTSIVFLLTLILAGPTFLLAEIKKEYSIKGDVGSKTTCHFMVHQIDCLSMTRQTRLDIPAVFRMSCLKQNNIFKLF